MEEKSISTLREIIRLLQDLEMYTYGDGKILSHHISPNVRSFSITAARLYEKAFEIMNHIPNKYVSPFKFQLIFDAKREHSKKIIEIEDNAKIMGAEDALKDYYTEITGLFDGFITYYNSTESNQA